MLLPLGAALVALAAALAAYVMVKFFGVIFLGQPREAALAHAHDAGIARTHRARVAGARLLRARSAAHAGHSALLRRVIAAARIGATLRSTKRPWWLLVPLPRAPDLLCPAGVSGRRSWPWCCSTIAAVRLFYHRRVRRAAPWDCGFGRLNARMQDTAEGFGQPIRHHLRAVLRDEARAAVARSTALRAIASSVGDRIWRGLYRAAGPARRSASPTPFAWLQQGRIATYLLYSFVTLVVLLALVL